MRPGDVVSYLDMCKEEGVNLQRGMNFHLKGNVSVILMSLRPGAPYADKIEENGKILIYEGHDIPKNVDNPNPKVVDQPFQNPKGGLTQNGLFFQAAKSGGKPLIKVYEKIRSGIWVYNGLFSLVDAWQEASNDRRVFKFKLEIVENQEISSEEEQDIENPRLIPAAIKKDVWKRDKGRCVRCGSTDNLHFDHIIPFSKGGTSLVTKNIQLLCARHNISKKDKIE